ncbi:YdiU family protein [Vibrio breoganii]|uniref:protein adenylyltransferase SelO n=1 Tax=Vibrio breoganii TaxID=553239 RepID=UPI000C86310B|nr:YdiU family protein [Vibrio breoganii]MDN3715737.1 YdiU family protein [Vibrio breoganii]PMK26418.1 hypothetical protein BCU03_02360 [Vibrio breoganii]
MKSLDQLDYCHTYADLGSSLSSRVNPTPLSDPYLIHTNQRLAKQLGIDIESVGDEILTQLMSGQGILESWSPIAMKYTGHQFGQYNPDLGDGRGLLLTEFINDDGEKWDFHLKGSGQTPYSRGADGRAVIRSSVREYLISAAMDGLSIPTTQALAISGASTPVRREEIESAATLLRIAPSHVRFGHFEYLFYSGQHSEIKALADYIILWHMPELKDSEDKYAAFFQQVTKRTASMIAHWQAYGFCHGVMNTDNMSILGLTFDYGPFAFLDTYLSKHICNHSDYSGRYAFHQQPGIGQWNLSALGYALSSLIDSKQIEASLQEYASHIQAEYRRLMRARFGLDSEHENDPELINSCLELMEKLGLDFHFTLRVLSETGPDNWTDTELNSTLNKPEFIAWLREYQQRIALDYSNDQERQNAMQGVNPKYILRTHLAQEAIEKVENGEFEILETWLTVLANPFIDHACPSHWSLPPSNDQKGICLSCSS